ncbi:major facilitator superfamily domain-containing protein [Hyaloraphidium curvatum]|nr:major facilitator superfamily domain-containing protein [Hyaloraphidium curvatum]
MRADTSLRAWLVLLAGFSGTLWSAAYVASWGVYQRTLIAEGAFDGATNFQLSFVGTIVFSVSVITAIFIGPLVDRLHPALLQGIGSLCCATALFTGSYAVYLWNLYLSSVLYGIGGSLLYVPGTVMTNQWFSKRRGLAMGLMSSGTGIGTFVVTAISQACITAGGWRFSLRIVSAVVLGWMLPCSLLLKRRIPKVPRKGPFITLRYFKNLTFSLVFLGIVIIMFVFFMPQAYIPLMLFDGGYSNAAGAAVVSAYSAVMAVGRIAGGFLSSRAGEVNMFVLACAVPMVSALVWLAAPTNLGVTIAASMAWALFCGAPLVTMPLICAQEFGLGELGSVLGVMMLSFWPGETWGNAILGAIVDANTSYAPDGTRLGANYRPMLGFSAAVWFLGGAAIMVLRWKQVRWKVLVKV